MRKIKKAVLVISALLCTFSLPASESLLREFLPAGVDYVTLFDPPRLTSTLLYAAMKKNGWDLVCDFSGDFTNVLGKDPDGLLNSVMVCGVRKHFLTFVKTGKNMPPVEQLLAKSGLKYPFFTYPPNSPTPFRVYYGKIYFTPFTPQIYVVSRSRSRGFLQIYLDNIAARGKGHERFLREMRLLAGENVFFRAAAFSRGDLFAKLPGLHACKKLTSFASVPGGDRLYMRGNFYFDNPEAARFAMRMVKQYQLLLIMTIAGENEALLMKLQKAFKYQINGKMLVAEFAPDKALTYEFIAVMVKKGTDILMNAADPKNLFRMPSRRK